MSNFYNKNLYKMLGVTSDATNAEIKVAYRTLVKKLHPDVNSNPKDEEKFKQLKDVYEILIDPEKRKKYDVLFSYYSAKNATKQRKPDTWEDTIINNEKEINPKEKEIKEETEEVQNKGTSQYEENKTNNKKIKRITGIKEIKNKQKRKNPKMKRILQRNSQMS